MSDEDYKKIKERLLRNGQLFEDPEFPASADSISKSGNVSKAIIWKRPKVRDDKQMFFFVFPCLYVVWIIWAQKLLLGNKTHSATKQISE